MPVRLALSLGLDRFAERLLVANGFEQMVLTRLVERAGEDHDTRDRNLAVSIANEVWSGIKFK